MAARLRRGTAKVVNAASRPSQAWPAVNQSPAQTSNTSSGSNSSSGWPAIGRTPVHASVSQPRPPASAVPQATRKAKKIPHSSSAPNLSDTRSQEPSYSDFPPVSSYIMQTHKPSSSTITQGSSNIQPPPDVQSANKSLIEKIRSALGHDEDLFNAIKTVSGQYRKGSIDARTYLEYVKGYGLSHLIIDLASLCPDPKRQKELIDTHNASLRTENGQAAAQSSSRAKGKAVVDTKEALAENFMETVRRLQSSQNPLEEEEEEAISNDKNMYRSDKGKSKVAGMDSSSNGSKQRKNKKTSKFHRVRLGDGSMAALLDLSKSSHEHEPEIKEDNLDSNRNQTGSVPVRGVWRKGGTNLFS